MVRVHLSPPKSRKRLGKNGATTCEAQAEQMTNNHLSPPFPLGCSDVARLKDSPRLMFGEAKIDNCIEEETSTKGNLQIDFG